MRKHLYANGGAIIAANDCGPIEALKLSTKTFKSRWSSAVRVELRLTPTEFRVLARLVRQAGRVVTHRQLLADVWGPEHVDDTQYLRLYLGQLRAKLERDPADPRLLLTEPGVGYRLANPGG